MKPDDKLIDDTLAGIARATDTHPTRQTRQTRQTSILNVVGGVEVECYDQTPGQYARVIIRNSRGQKIAAIFVTATPDGITFTQQSSEAVSEKHSFVVLPDQQFCGAKLSDSFLCCLPSSHKIHNKEE